MKKEHINKKALVISFILGFLLAGGLSAYCMRPVKQPPIVQWCVGNQRFCEWAKARHEKVLKAAEEVYLEK